MPWAPIAQVQATDRVSRHACTLGSHGAPPLWGFPGALGDDPFAGAGARMHIPVHHLVVVICPGSPAAASIRATPWRSWPRRRLIGLRIRPRRQYARRPLQPAPGAAKVGYFRLGLGQLLLNCGRLAAQRVDLLLLRSRRRYGRGVDTPAAGARAPMVPPLRGRDCPLAGQSSGCSGRHSGRAGRRRSRIDVDGDRGGRP